MFLGKNKYNIFSLFSLSDQGPSAASTHTSQYRGRGANLRGHKVCPNSDTAVSKLLRGHHERLIGRGRCPSAQWRRSSPVLRWQQLHYVHEGGGGQVRRAKKCQTSLTLYGLSFNNMVKKILLGRYRITIGNKTCVFEKENDPSLLRSPSAGKLIQFTVEDGGHLFAGQCYAEIEVKCAVFGNIYTSTWVYIRNQIFSTYRLEYTEEMKPVTFPWPPGDEDGNDSYHGRVWMHTLRQEGWSSTGTWLCHCQASVRWSEQSAASNEW